MGWGVDVTTDPNPMVDLFSKSDLKEDTGFCQMFSKTIPAPHPDH